MKYVAMGATLFGAAIALGVYGATGSGRMAWAVFVYWTIGIAVVAACFKVRT